MIPKSLAFGALALSMFAGVATAAPISINFEGSRDGALINGFYAGGTDSFGNRGTDYGITFNEGATVRIDYGKTYLTNVTSMSVRDGFANGLTFQYATLGSSPNDADSNDIAVRLDNHPDPSYWQVLSNTYVTDCTRYAGGYCFFAGGFARTAEADEIAHSVNFRAPPYGGGASLQFTAVDTITFGITPVIFQPGRNIPPVSRVGNDPLLVAQVPEPATAALLGLGLLGVIGARRRKK